MNIRRLGRIAETLVCSLAYILIGVMLVDFASHVIDAITGLR